MNDSFQTSMSITLKQYEAIVLQTFLRSTNDRGHQDPAVQKVLFDLEAILERDIFRESGLPDVPIGSIERIAREMVIADLE